MDHEVMAGPSGTFIGHLGPGIVFMVWGLWWMSEVVVGGPRRAGEPIERSLIVPALKFVALIVGGGMELPNAGWYPMDWVMGWHHITVYIAFALSGVVDLLARRGVLTARATHLALAGAGLTGALLFFGHGIDPGVEGVAHKVLMMLFLGVGAFAVLEVAAPSWPFAWFRIGSMIALGAWMCITAWMLYVSGWDLNDHVREAHVWLRFSWMALTVATLATGACLLSERRATPKRGT